MSDQDKKIKELEAKHKSAWEKNQFQPGQSGNPKGRPKGSKNKLTLLREDAEKDLIEGITADMSAVLQMAITKAKDGDNQMIKLLVDKFISNKHTIDDKAITSSGGINIIVKTSGETEIKTVEGETYEQDE
jgi:uncharacterized protein (DUF305 family)